MIFKLQIPAIKFRHNPTEDLSHKKSSQGPNHDGSHFKHEILMGISTRWPLIDSLTHQVTSQPSPAGRDVTAKIKPRPLEDYLSIIEARKRRGGVSVYVCVCVCVCVCVWALLLGIIFQVGATSSLGITMLIKTFLYYIFCAYCINTQRQFPEKAPSHACFKVIFFHTSF